MILWCSGFVIGVLLTLILFSLAFYKVMRKRNLLNADGSLRDLSFLDEEE